jgi:hypothetical protein
MDELARWLGQQLDEDERTARAAHPVFLHWEYDDCVKEIRDFGNGNTLATGVLPHYGAFMHEHDPARVLREIDAKRELLRQYEHLKHEVMPDDMSGVFALEAVIRAHAQVYDTRPGYKESWRP